MAISDRNKLNNLTGKEWIKHTKSFINSTKSKVDKLALEHPAPFLFEDIKFLIEMFTKENGLILEPFAGSGTTLLASKALNRKCIGFDLQNKYKDLFNRRLKENEFDDNDIEYKIGNSLELIKTIKDESIDYMITSPPYHNILNNKNKGIRNTNSKYRTGARTKQDNYSEDKEDLGNQEEYNIFLSLLSSLFENIYKKLKIEKYATIIISDFTVNKKEINVQGDIVNMMEKIGFRFVGTQILLQNSKPLYPFGYPYKFIINHHHQNIIHFIKM